jgi:hypothetical protein
LQFISSRSLFGYWPWSARFVQNSTFLGGRHIGATAPQGVLVLVCGSNDFLMQTKVLFDAHQTLFLVDGHWKGKGRV